MSDSLGFIWRQWGSSWRVLRKKVIQWDLHCRKVTCWNLETKWEGEQMWSQEGCCCSVSDISRWGPHLCENSPKNSLWALTILELGRPEVSVVSLKPLRLGMPSEPPGPELSRTHTSFPVVCSGRYRYRCSKAVSFWVVQLWWKGGLIQRQGQLCAQVHLLFYQVTVTNELTMLLRWIPFFAACVISHKILTFHPQTSPS